MNDGVTFFRYVEQNQGFEDEEKRNPPCSQPICGYVIVLSRQVNVCFK